MLAEVLICVGSPLLFREGLANLGVGLRAYSKRYGEAKSWPSLQRPLIRQRQEMRKGSCGHLAGSPGPTYHIAQGKSK